MLELDSPRWATLTHAYGPATDTPDLLRRLTDDPTDQVWDDLFGSVVHQGSVYSSSFAAVPHVVAAAAHYPLANRLTFVSLAGAVASGYGAPPIPGDLREGYEDAVRQARLITLELLPTLTTHLDIVNALEALSALAGKITLARVLDSLTNEEFHIRCAECESALYVEVKAEVYLVYEGDYVEKVGLASKPIECTALISDDLIWLKRFAPACFQGHIDRVGGTSTCPCCEAPFALYERLAAELGD